MTKINLSELGKMLNKAFSNNEVDKVAFDLSLGFQDEISAYPKSKKIIEIIRYAAHHGKLNQIIEFTKSENPHQFENFANVLFDGNLTRIDQISAIDEEDDEIREILTQISGLMRDLVSKGLDDQIIINSDNITKSYQYNSTGEGSQTVNHQSVNVTGKNDGNIIIGDGNKVTDNSKRQDFTFGDNTNMHGTINAVITESIKDTLHAVDHSKSADEIKLFIKSMLDAVENVAKEVSAEKRGEVERLAKYSKRLADDAISDKPDEEDAQFSLMRLSTAAEHIGAAANPVVVAAKSIVQALGFAS